MSSRYISTTVLAATAAAFTLFGSSGGIAMAYETSNKGQSLSTNREVNTFDINFHPMQSEELYSTYGRHDDSREDEEEVTSSSAPDKVLGFALSSQYYSYGGGGDKDDQPKPPKLAKAEKTSAPTVSPVDDESSASYFGKLLISLHLRCVCCVCVL